jgi:hypothetical protein
MTTNNSGDFQYTFMYPSIAAGLNSWADKPTSFHRHKTSNIGIYTSGTQTGVAADD